MKEERSSNFELLRVTSMFMIILWHTIIHSGIIGNSVGVLNVVLNFILCVCIVHVNSFLLLTGYFQYDLNFSRVKFLKLFCLQWFYRYFIIVILVMFGLVTVSKFTFFMEILPIGSADNYWFVNNYLVLYLLSPFINRLIKNLDLKEYRKLLIISFVLFSLISYFFDYNILEKQNIVHFIFLYLLGAYLHKYNIKSKYKKITDNNLFMFIIFVVMAILNWGLILFSNYFINSNNELISFISHNVLYKRYEYISPFIIIQTLAFFFMFKNLKIKSKIINYCASLTFGIYLIHDNSYIRLIIYKVFINPNSLFTSCGALKIVFEASILVFLICMFIELLRKIIVKGIFKISHRILEK